MQQEIQWLLREKYRGQPSKPFEKDVDRLKKGEPLDYVIGWKEFLGCRIDLSKKPLIPRVETEFWVDEVLKEMKNQPSPRLRRGEEGKALDIFSGSGCIGIAIMRQNKDILCDFADIETAQIKINCKLNNVTGKIFTSDVFEKVEGKYDYIFANPPYIPTVNKNKIQASALKFEPKKALFGGKDGLFFIKKFLKEAPQHLNVGGNIFMEFDPPQKKEIEKLLKKFEYAHWEFKKDQFNKWRWVSIDN
jgi:release factor glutamine methyltransferase